MDVQPSGPGSPGLHGRGSPASDLRAIIELAPVGIAQFDEQGRFLLVNDRLCEILGFTRAELLACTFQEISFPDDLPRCLELTRALASGEIPGYSLEKRFVLPSGDPIWTRITVSVVRGEDGRPRFFIGTAEDVSERIAAAEERARAEERLRAALEASMIGTFRFDLRSDALEWADGLARVFGGVERSTLQEFLALMHPDDREHVFAAYTRSVTEGADFEEEFRVLWPDGTTHWLHDRGRTFAGEDGRPRYIIGAITDVTKHKRMEEVLRAREAEFRTLADAIPQLAWISDSDGNRSWFNERWHEFTGEDVTTHGGRGWLGVHSPGTAEEILASQLDAFRKGIPWERTVRLRGKDGSQRWFLSRAVPVRAEDGRVLHWIGTDTDVTEQRLAEQLLRQRETRFRTALDVESIGVIFFDNEHRVTGVNRAFERMSGYPAEEVEGRVLWHDLTSAEGRQVAERRASQYDDSGRTTPDEQEYVRKDGTRWWALVTANRVGPGEGVKFVIDISDRKRAEAELAELLTREQTARRVAEEATAQRQQVLAIVAHDLRNPVQTIVMSSGLLLELPLDGEQRTRQAELIKRAAWRMDRLIADLLDASQMDAGTFTVRREPVEVASVLGEVAETFAEQARVSEVELTFETSPELTFAHLDRQRLVQGLSNLVGNALKFTAPGGRVEVTAARGADAMTIEVRDSGRGIKPDELPAIFDRFWQADREQGGAGLGLSITRGIVEAHGGSIRVESVVDRGTTFHVQLPLEGR